MPRVLERFTRFREGDSMHRAEWVGIRPEVLLFEVVRILMKNED